MRRWRNTIVITALIISVSWLLLQGGSPLWAATSLTPRNQVPVVSPDAITTPAPTPVPASPGAEADAPVSTHGFDQARYYTVQPGDTVLSVALEVGIDVDRMGCVVAPDFTWDQPLIIGDPLEVPPASLLCHTVQPGDTVLSVAGQYGLTPDALLTIAWNRLASVEQALVPGHHLRIPAPLDPTTLDPAASQPVLAHLLGQPVNAMRAVKAPVGGALETPPEGPVPANWPYGSGNFRWPTYGWLSQGYSWTHRAVDIAAPPGTIVTAADRGVVVRAGWNTQGYGNFVVIDHNIDYVTLYAHLYDIYVEEGQVVAAGAPLGTVGSTGNSTGPHLHFEIRDFGYRTDPVPLLLK